jgi:uncharacterized protein (DUF2126 family)
MAEPIVFISRSRMIAGPRAAFEAAYAEAVALIASTKPRTALFAAYLDESGTEVRVVHAFPDGAAMVAHFEGSEERSRGASSLMVPVGFEVYGRPPDAAINQLRREANEAGIELDVLPEPAGGFLRAPG